MILLENLNLENIRNLCLIYKNDTKLASYEDRETFDSSPEELLNNILKWCRKTNSKSFAICFDNKTIGLISLSHIDLVNKSARCGYMISSDFWNKGITSKAFKLIIDKARYLGIKALTATINEDNLASIKIWQKYNALIIKSDKPNMIEVKLII